MIVRKPPHVSVVSPVYGCYEALPELCKKLHSVLERITENYEIIFVNDASPDNSWDLIKGFAASDKRVKGINLSRNFGQHQAITAGVDFADGDWVVVLDCDLQYNPQDISKLYHKAQSGYDVVFGYRKERKDSWFKKNSSRLFYHLFTLLSGVKVNSHIANFVIISRKVVQNFRSFKERNRSFGLLILWAGFRRTEIEIEHSPRQHGNSSYSFRKMILLAIDSVVAHSDAILRLMVMLGIFISTISIFYVIWLVLNNLLWATPIIGWTSLIVSVFFTSGLIIGSIGIVGLYVGYIFNEVKGRPLYIIDSTTFESSSYDT